MRTSLLWPLALAATLFACPDRPPCSPSSCPSGCCDSTNQCVTGQLQNACGSNGLTCSVCASNQACLSGLCTTIGSGGSGATGGLGGSGGTGGTAGTGGDGILTVTTAYCDWLERCGRLETSQLSAARCAQLLKPYLFSGAAAAVEIGAANVDTAAAAACAATVAASPCRTSSPSSDGCFSIVTGTATLGQRCAGSCLEGYCPSSMCNARCVAGGGLGEPCRYRLPTAQQCNAGLVCNWDSLCQLPLAPGATCTVDRDCGPTGACPSGTCVTLPAVGQPCATSFPRCQSDAFCNGTTCQARLTAGATCSSTSSCAEGLFCSSGSRCTDKLGIGGRCRAGSECVSGTCDSVLRTCRSSQSEGVPAGQSCTETYACAGSLACRGLFINPDGGIGSAGTCGATQPGDACTSHSQCPLAHHCGVTSRVCTPSTVASPCSYSDENCRSTEYCNSSNTCAPRYGTGQPCDSNHSSSCAATSERCVTVADGGAVCRSTDLGVDEPCGTQGTCKIGLGCINGRCTRVGQTGQPCRSGECFDGLCRGSDGGYTGVCGARGMQGEVCFGRSGLSGDPCATGLVCTSGTCQTGCP